MVCRCATSFCPHPSHRVQDKKVTIETTHENLWTESEANDCYLFID